MLSTSESAEVHETQTDPLFGTTLDTVEERIDHQLMVGLMPIHSPTADVPPPKLEFRPLRAAALTKVFGTFVALAIGFWLVSASGKTRSVPHVGGAMSEETYGLSKNAAGGEASTHDEDTASETTANDPSEEMRRLQTVRGLLPAASRLAAAIGTSEAENILSSVHKSFSVVGHTAGLALDSKRIEDSIKSGLQGLRLLHTVALRHAAALADDGTLVPSFSVLESEEVGTWVEDEIKHVFEGDTVLPFIVYMHSLKQSVIDISQRFTRARDRLSMVTPFRDERDEDRLISAAAELDWLLSLGERKRQMIERAATLKDCAISGVRIHLKYHVEEWIRTLQGSLELVHAHVDLVSNDLESSFENSSTLEHAVEDTGNIHTIRRKLAKVNDLLQGMRRAKQAVHESTSVEIGVSAFKEAEQLMKEAQDLVDDCWEAANTLSSRQVELSSSDVALLESAAAKTRVIVDEQKASIVASLSIVHNRCLDALHGDGTMMASAKHINSSVAEHLRSQAFSIEQMVASRYQGMQNIATQLRETKDLKDATSLLENLEEYLPIFVELNKRAVLLVLESYLHIMLEDDIQASVKIATRASSSKFLITGPNRMHFEDLRLQFDDAKKMANNASNLTEAVKAAANVSQHAYALNDFAEGRWRGQPDLFAEGRWRDQPDLP
ncbi:hypothetical protein, conserved [Eimeria maxima]|uniref:Uncharacterized protein n=1 Tax=Eimeria maxima TaxID=5804 RepID=U6MBR3_EIMMA|nr:hypothetical protein, conserved [Eimeria maxima]CDJ59919.1 hypothetical protein, conserved [Eimeria maxima]